MRVVVIGTSAGGLRALGALVERLPADLPAALLAVQHIGAYPSLLPELLAPRTALAVRQAEQGARLAPGSLQIAPPDRHLLLAGDELVLSHGPKEHHTRPAVDPLFRSAAASRRDEVIGVVLTGMLDDGTAGLRAIKDCGGIAIVQDPAEAEHRGMPQSALDHVAVDHCARLEGIAALLVELAHRPQERAMARTPQQLVHEIELFEGRGDPLTHLRALGAPSTFTCPNCHGTLWRLKTPGPVRFRCHVGHGYTGRTLVRALGEARDDALWNALRALRESVMLLQALRQQGEGDAESARVAAMLEQQAEALRALIEKRSPAQGAPAA